MKKNLTLPLVYASSVRTPLTDASSVRTLRGAMIKDERVYVRMTDDEKQKARKVAEALRDESVSQTMRRLLRDKYDELFDSAGRRKRVRSK